MTIFSVSVIVLVSLHYVHCGILDRILQSSAKPNVQARDFTLDSYGNYLSNFLNEEVMDEGLQVDYPRSLDAPNYQLRDGNLERFYDPLNLHGSFDRVRFHRLPDSQDVYGVVQVYAPKVEFVYRYSSGSGSGSFKLFVNHDPIQMNMDLGTVQDGTCTINREREKPFFFYDHVKVQPTISADSGAGGAAAEQIVQEIANSWLNDFYKAMFEVKLTAFVVDVKTKMLEDNSAVEAFAHICKRVQ